MKRSLESDFLSFTFFLKTWPRQLDVVIGAARKPIARTKLQLLRLAWRNFARTWTFSLSLVNADRMWVDTMKCEMKYWCILSLSKTLLKAAPKDFWCERPSHLRSIPVDLWRKLTSPAGDSCNRYNIPYSSISAFNFTSSLERVDASSFGLVACTAWEFDMSLIGKTIVSEWNIVCDRHSLESIVEACFLAGAGLGSVSSGWISDRYGRRNTLMIFASIQFVVGELKYTFFLATIMFFCFKIGCNINEVLVLSGGIGAIERSSKPWNYYFRKFKFFFFGKLTINLFRVNSMLTNFMT